MLGAARSRGRELRRWLSAGTTAQGHSDECRARIEQNMLEDVTGEGAMRFEEAIRRKRARLDDESGRADVAM